MTKSSKDMARMLTWLSAAVVFVLVVVLPVSYFLVSYRYAAGSLESEAEINARIVNQIVSASPRLWKYEQARLLEYLSRRPRKGNPEIRRVFDSEGKLVAESVDPLPKPHLVRTSPIYDAGAMVGTLSVARSMQPLLYQTGLLLLIVVPFGITVFMLLSRAPIRAIRENEALLRRERDTAQRYLDVAGVMILALDRKGKVAMVNRKGCAILGKPEDGVLGTRWLDSFVPEEDRAESRARYERLITGGTGTFVTYAGAVRTGSGERRYMAWNVIALDDEQGGFAGTLWSGEDITDRVQLEEELRHAHKLEAIGQLAGGVAHDFNNILAAIVGFGSLVHMKMDKADPLRHYVDEILAASKRATSITQRLLAFSRKQIIKPQQVDLNEIIRSSARMLRRLLRSDIDVSTELAPLPLVIMADNVQIDQVLLNLVANARDAMPEGGRLIIQTERVDISAEKIAALGLDRPGPYARLTVTDTGHGMDEATQRRIFEPFYSTKEVGKGTGLGLASAYGIVKQHGGAISVVSAPGKGAAFTILLPIIASSVQQAEPENAPLLARGDGTILLAEDEAAVRNAMRSLLESAGYEVIEARDGGEAVDLFRQARERIRLVVMDVIMPKKNGKAALAEIRAMRPDIKALFVSGYSADIIRSQEGLDGEYAFIAKPVQASELLHVVAKVLAG